MKLLRRLACLVLGHRWAWGLLEPAPDWCLRCRRVRDPLGGTHDPQPANLREGS